MANKRDQLGILISCDADDDSMTRGLVKEELERTISQCAWSKVCYGNSKSKIEACNADIASCDWSWDIIVLVSDDMQPQVKGYDDVIRSHMMTFRDTDAILWFNDGFQASKLNTLTIFGRAMYDRFGYLYHPDYISLYCDTELTDLCRTTLKDKTLYIPYCIIRHEHPMAGYGGNDALYAQNSKFWNQDMHTYIRRKKYDVDVSFLIPTIPGREDRLQSLIKSITSRAPFTVEIKIDFDNRESSIGIKRHRLLQAARGRYIAFVDDDDELTDEYFQDIAATIAGGYDVMRLRGQISWATFTHSLANTLLMPMAMGDVFLRPPNHLNPMLADIAKNVPFRDATRGEDLDWAINLSKLGFLQSEYEADPSRIHYIYNLRSEMDHRSIEYQRTHSYEDFIKLVWLSPGMPEIPPKRGGGLRLGLKGFVSK